MNTRPIPTPEAVEAAINLGWNADCKIEEAERRLTPKAEGLWLDLYRASAVVLAIEVQRLRALVDEPQGKQIKPGPSRLIHVGSIKCNECQRLSHTREWFAGGYSPVCPACGAEFVCNAGRIDKPQRNCNNPRQ